MIAELVCIFDPVVTSYSRGDGKWFVQFYDRATSSFYAGTGATAFEALAWAMDEYQTRGMLRIHRVARHAHERPGDFVKTWDRLRSERGIRIPIEPAEIEHRIATAPIAFQNRTEPLEVDPIANPRAPTSDGCFALQIDAATPTATKPKQRKKAKP